MNTDFIIDYAPESCGGEEAGGLGVVSHIADGGHGVPGDGLRCVTQKLCNLSNIGPRSSPDLML